MFVWSTKCGALHSILVCPSRTSKCASDNSLGRMSKFRSRAQMTLGQTVNIPLMYWSNSHHTKAVQFIPFCKYLFLLLKILVWQKWGSRQFLMACSRWILFKIILSQMNWDLKIICTVEKILRPSIFKLSFTKHYSDVCFFVNTIFRHPAF